MKLDAGSRGWNNFGLRWTREVGGLGNSTVFMDVICVSSLTYFLLKIHCNVIHIFIYNICIRLKGDFPVIREKKIKIKME